MAKAPATDVTVLINKADLVVFSGSWCPYCKRAIAAIDAAGYTPEVIEITDELKMALSQKTGQTSVPQVFIRGQFIGGCNDGGLGGVVPLLNSGKFQQLMEK